MRHLKTKKVFDIPGISPDMMQLIVEFAHTGSVSVTEENVRELLLAVKPPNSSKWRTSCKLVATSWWSSSARGNCIGLLQFSNIWFSSSLRDKAYRHIIDHFDEVVLSGEFPQLSVHKLTGILGSDDLM